jgi:hypothetical protein
MSWQQQNGGGYNGAPSSGYEARAYHEQDKKKKQEQQTMLAIAGGLCVLLLMILVWSLSGRGTIPSSYRSEGREQCQNANYLCDTICGNLPGHYKDPGYKIACERGCNEWGVAACESACETNDLPTCVSSMAKKTHDQYCNAFPPDPDPSPHRACLIGAKGVSSTTWPCKQGISIIGKILAAHK